MTVCDYIRAHIMDAAFIVSKYDIAELYKDVSGTDMTIEHILSNWQSEWVNGAQTPDSRLYKKIDEKYFPELEQAIASCITDYTVKVTSAYINDLFDEIDIDFDLMMGDLDMKALFDL